MVCLYLLQKLGSGVSLTALLATVNNRRLKAGQAKEQHKFSPAAVQTKGAGRYMTGWSRREGEGSVIKQALARLAQAAATALCPTACRYLAREGMSSAGRLCGVHTGTPTNSRSACGSGGEVQRWGGKGASSELAWQQERACLHPEPGQAGRPCAGRRAGRQAAPVGPAANPTASNRPPAPTPTHRHPPAPTGTHPPTLTLM